MDAVTDIKDRLSIEDVVSEYVQLKRAGRNFKGLSPFANEKTPSFMVSPEKQIWHDFSSGKGGDVFGFIMEVEGLDFKAALELLARKAGVDLSQYRTSTTTTSDSSKIKSRLYALLDASATFYQRQLTQHTEALTYVRTKRNFSKQTILDFRLGYSPSGGKDLTTYLLNKSFTVEEMKKAGLVSVRGRDVFDMFRGRIMVPLCDAQGQVVGFTARQLKQDDNSPKYINTPATLLYDKGRQAYGLHLAKDAIRKSSFVVIVEGNLDVIASHQAGVKNVVATAGTAMTVHHLKMLKRFTGDIRLCFDGDSAGQNAAERAIDLAAEAGVTLQMISLPQAKDPDELINQDPQLWQNAIQSPQYVIDWLIERYESHLDITTAIGKRQLSDAVLRLIARIQDPVEQDHYMQVLAKKIGVSVEALHKKLASTRKPESKKLKQTRVQQTDKGQQERIKLEQHLLAMVYARPQLAGVLVGLPTDIFIQDGAQAIGGALQQGIDLTTQANILKKHAEYVKMLVLLSEELYQNPDDTELQYQLEQLIARLVTEYVKNKKQALRQNLQDEDTAVLQQMKELDDLAKLFQSA